MRIPDTAIGFISVRFTLKRRGIVNVSGFHVDPGSVGRLKFAVYNAGSQNIVISRGDRAHGCKIIRHSAATDVGALIAAIGERPARSSSVNSSCNPYFLSLYVLSLPATMRTSNSRPGLEADLIVVERDPTVDLEALGDVLFVLNNGKIVINRLRH